MSSPRASRKLTMLTVVPRKKADHDPPIAILVESAGHDQREERDLLRVSWVGQSVIPRCRPGTPRLHHHVALGIGMSEPLWATPFSSFICPGRVAYSDSGTASSFAGVMVVEASCTNYGRAVRIGEREDRVRAPFVPVAEPALRLSAAAPFVGEQHLRPVVVERRRVPVREVRVCYRGDTHRMRGITDVQEESVPFTRAAGQSDGRIDGDVVTLRRAGTRTGSRGLSRRSAWR